MADFDEKVKQFHLHHPPVHDISSGLYALPDIQDKPHTAKLHRIASPLGEWCITQGLNTVSPITKLRFHYTAQAHKISILAEKHGQSGWLHIDKLRFSSPLQHEEKLIFTACTDSNEWLDDTFCRKLLLLPASTDHQDTMPPSQLADNTVQARQAAISRQAEHNHSLLAAESERLDKWSTDQKLAAQQELDDTYAQIQEAKRQKRQATNLAEQQLWEKKQRDLEKLLRQQRNRIWDEEDKIEAKRDELIEKIESQLQQTSSIEEILTIRWEII